MVKLLKEDVVFHVIITVGSLVIQKFMKRVIMILIRKQQSLNKLIVIRLNQDHKLKMLQLKDKKLPLPKKPQLLRLVNQVQLKKVEF